MESDNYSISLRALDIADPGDLSIGMEPEPDVRELLSTPDAAGKVAAAACVDNAFLGDDN